MNKEEIKQWIDKYNSDITKGEFTCFFCEKKYSVKEQLGFIKTIKSQTILGCSICIKDSSVKAWEKVQELELYN